MQCLKLRRDCDSTAVRLARDSHSTHRSRTGREGVALVARWANLSHIAFVTGFQCDQMLQFKQTSQLHDGMLLNPDFPYMLAV